MSKSRWHTQAVGSEWHSTSARRVPALAFPAGQAGGHLRIAAPLRRATRHQEARLPRARSAHDRRRHALRRLPHNRSDLGRTNTGSRKVATGLPDLLQLRGLLRCVRRQLRTLLEDLRDKPPGGRIVPCISKSVSLPERSAALCTFGSAALRVDARGAGAATQPAELTSAGPPPQCMPRGSSGSGKQEFVCGLLMSITTATAFPDSPKLPARKQLLAKLRSPGPERDDSYCMGSSFHLQSYHLRPVGQVRICEEENLLPASPSHGC